MSNKEEIDSEGGTGLLLEEAKPEVKEPPLYKVMLMNDDYTPMDFVVHILENFFSMDHDKATSVMLNVHHKGKGLCGTFTRDVAETKTVQVNDYSRTNNHPLMCTMEKA